MRGWREGRRDRQRDERVERGEKREMRGWREGRRERQRDERVETETER